MKFMGDGANRHAVSGIKEIGVSTVGFQSPRRNNVMSVIPLDGDGVAGHLAAVARGLEHGTFPLRRG